MSVSDASARLATQETSTASTPDSTSAGLPFLPPDILALIVDYLTLENAKSLSLVSQALYRQSRYRTLRTITIDLKASDFEPTRLWLQALERGKWLPAVRTLTVLDVEYDYHRRQYHCGKDEPQNKAERAHRIDDICRALRAKRGPLILDWQSNNIPNAVLECAEGLPHVRLSVHVHEHRQRQLRAINTSTDSLLHRLQRCRNLNALDVEVQYIKADECIAFMRVLKCVLLTCQNLRYLRLNVHMPQSGCCIYDTPSRYHGLGFIGEEKLPALEELDLVAYPFGNLPITGREIESSIYYSADVDERTFWADRFEWSRLKRLSTCDLEFAHLVAPQLATVRDVTYDDGAAYDLFLLGVPTRIEPISFLNVPSSLQSISLGFDRRLGPESILQHGPTLRKLSLHGMEAYRRLWGGQCLGIEELREPGSACPILEDLEIDLCRDDTAWPYPALDIIASYPKLAKLTLWFSLPMCDSIHGVGPHQPFMTFAAATMFFRYLRDHGSRITELVVHSGAPPPAPLGEVALEADWPEQNSTTFLCALAERDWEVAQGIFTTTCLDVGKDANEWMRAQEGQLSSLAKKDIVDFDTFCENMASTPTGRIAKRCLRVAWLGPTALEDWREYEESL